MSCPPRSATGPSPHRPARAARLRRGASAWATSRVPSALSTPMSVAGKGIRPGEHAHGDQLHRPFADAGQRTQRVQRGLQRRARCSSMRPVGHRARQRLQRRDALAHDAQPADALGRRPGDRLRRWGTAGPGRQTACRCGSPSSADQAARQRARGGHRDLLAQDDARGGLEAVHRARHAQAGAAAAPGSVARQGSISAGSASRSSAWRSRCMMLPTAGSRDWRHAQVQFVALRHEAALQPALQPLPLVLPAQRAAHMPGPRPPRRRAARAAPGSAARRRCRKAAGRPGAAACRCRAGAWRRCAACRRSALGFMR